MNDSHKKRHQKERHIAQCEHFLDVLETIHPVSNRLNSKLRLMRFMSSDNLKEASKHVAEFSVNDKEEFKFLMAKNIPIELLIEYIGAPQNAMSSNDEARQTIFNRLTKDLPITDNIHRRTCYGISYIAFALSFGAAGVRLANFNNPNDPVNTTLTSILNTLPQAMRSLGAPGALFIQNNSYLTEISAAIFLAMGLGLSFMDRYSKKQERVAAPRQKISLPNNPLSEQAMGYTVHQEKIDFVLNKLTERDKHLLNHLSPFALRAVLTSPPEVVEDILKYHKISFEQKTQYVAKELNFLNFLGHMMIIAFPSPLKNFITSCCDAVGLEVKPELVSPQAFAKRLEQYRSPSATTDNNAAISKLTY